MLNVVGEAPWAHTSADPMLYPFTRPRADKVPSTEVLVELLLERLGAKREGRQDRRAVTARLEAAARQTEATEVP